MAPATGWFRGENGLVLEMDLPLPDGFEGRLKRGEITRVNEDGTPWEPEAAAAESLAGEAELPADQELIAALAENAGLSDEIALLTKQRDELAVDVGQVKEQLAQVTKERDELLQALTELKPAEPAADAPAAKPAAPRTTKAK